MAKNNSSSNQQPVSIEQRLEMAAWMANHQVDIAKKELASALASLERRMESIGEMIAESPDRVEQAVSGVESYAASVAEAARKVKDAKAIAKALESVRQA